MFFKFENLSTNFFRFFGVENENCAVKQNPLFSLYLNQWNIYCTAFGWYIITNDSLNVKRYIEISGHMYSRLHCCTGEEPHSVQKSLQRQHFSVFLYTILYPIGNTEKVANRQADFLS